MTTFDNEEFKEYLDILIDRFVEVKDLKNVDMTDDQIIQFYEKYEKHYRVYKEREEEIDGFLSKTSEGMEKTQNYYKYCKCFIDYLKPLYKMALSYPLITDKLGVLLESMIKNTPQSDINEDKVKETRVIIENYSSASAALCDLFERYINILKKEYNLSKHEYKQFKESHQKWLNVLEGNRIDGKRGLDLVKKSLKYLKKVERAECHLELKQVNEDLKLVFNPIKRKQR